MTVKLGDNFDRIECWMGCDDRNEGSGVKQLMRNVLNSGQTRTPFDNLMNGVRAIPYGYAKAWGDSNNEKPMKARQNLVM